METAHRSGPDRRRLALVTALTAVAGAVDAAAFVALDHVFVANQTGNGVLLVVALAHALLSDGRAPSTWGEALPPLLSLAGFLAGAALSAAVVRTERGGAGPAPGRWSLPALETAALLAAALAPLPVRAAVPVAAFGMGVQSVRGSRARVPGATTTVVTGTLAALFGNLAEGARAFPRTGFLALAALVYLGAALAGAVVAATAGFAAVAVPACCVVLGAALLG